MTRSIRVESSPITSPNTLLTDKPAVTATDKRRIGEVAGGAAGKCAVLSCFCPCVVLHLLVLAVYKVPAGLCRKARKAKKRQRSKKQLLKSAPQAQGSDVDGEEKDDTAAEKGDKMIDGGLEMEMEMENWERFHGNGFWRSDSMRET